MSRPFVAAAMASSMFALAACTAAPAGTPSRPPDAPVMPRDGASATKPDRSLVNTYWRLVELNGARAAVAPNQREPHLILQISGDRVVGSGGCNRLTGTYTLHGDFVGFGRVATTEMACTQGMDQEAAFLRTLEQVKSWRIRGDDLALLDASNAIVLLFAAVDFR